MSNNISNPNALSLTQPSSSANTSEASASKESSSADSTSTSTSTSTSSDAFSGSGSNYDHILGQVASPTASSVNYSEQPTTPEALRQQAQLAAQSRDCVEYEPNPVVPNYWSPVGDPTTATDSPTDACPPEAPPSAPATEPGNTTPAAPSGEADEAPQAPQASDSDSAQSTQASESDSANDATNNGPAQTESNALATATKAEVDRLNSPGDSVRISGALSGKIEFGAKVGSEMEIQRTNDGYTVSLAGNAGGIFEPEAGVSVVGKLEAQLNAEVSGLAKTELSFSSRAELDSFIDAASTTNPASASERQELRQNFGQNISATEYGVRVSGALGATAGVGKTAGGDLGIGTEYQGVLRREFQNGEESSAALRVDLKPSVAVEGGAVLMDRDGDMFGPRAHLGANVQASLELKLKRNETTGELVRDGQATMTVNGEINAQVLGAGGNLRGQFQVDLDTARTRELLSEVDQAEDGREAALDYLRAAGELPKVSLEGSAYQSEAIKLSPELSAGGMGVTTEVEFERQDVGQIYTYELTPSQALGLMGD